VLGVKPAYRGRGIESMMLAEGLKVGFKAGLRAAEASWVLEDNIKSRRVTETFGGKPYKTYRLYDREVPP
jgi:GNAT superfamily N-acetyltransferase